RRTTPDRKTTMAIRALPHRRPWLLDRPLRAIVRGVAFTGKELHEIFRQPRLLLGLVVGPFAILLLFGTAFKGQVVQQPTVLVVPEQTGLSTNVADYADAFQFPFTLQSVVRTPEEAQGLFTAGKASVIVALPADAYQRIRDGQHALVNVTYNELEPVRSNYLKFYSYVEANELNRRVLIAVVNQAKNQNQDTAGPPLQGYTQQIQATTTQYTDRVRGRDAKGAADALAQMQAATVNNQSDLRTREQLLAGAEHYFNAPTNANDDLVKREAAVDQSLGNVDTIIRNLGASLPQNLATGQPDTKATEDLVANSQSAEQGAQALQLPPAEVLVAPFQAEVNNKAPVLPSFIAFYAPAVLALLLQHVSITLTALTLVRERTSGATELFRVTPSATPEMLIAAALGLGLVISAVATSETQAVQYAMLVLLASVFFGNFFLPIDTLYPWARVISYALPITYGVQAMQNIMLRGIPANPNTFIALGAFAVGFFLLGTLLFRRTVRKA
ncbi:MAG: ABC transporter permease, partial [Thermomicrobia bacterium]|nr:ABC transporter permease [Thermomicrobia bacterium]